MDFDKLFKSTRLRKTGQVCVAIKSDNNSTSLNKKYVKS